MISEPNCELLVKRNLSPKPLKFGSYIFAGRKIGDTWEFTKLGAKKDLHNTWATVLWGLNPVKLPSF